MKKFAVSLTYFIEAENEQQAQERFQLLSRGEGEDNWMTHEPDFEVTEEVE